MAAHDRSLTVESAFNIDEDELSNRAEEDEYWDRSHKFYLDVKGQPLANLTERQEAWLEKIEERLGG